MNKQKKIPKNGFTLIEIIIAVALLGIIAVSFLSAMTGQFRILSKTKDLTMASLETQEEMEKNINAI
jgi:prepilin-type N-terminal cleavage/methylation domain-containing protein